jgi:hypothetical protein
MKRKGSSETFKNFNQTTWHHFLKDSILQILEICKIMP